jgi:hypothetical protein
MVRYTAWMVLHYFHTSRAHSAIAPLIIWEWADACTRLDGASHPGARVRLQGYVCPSSLAVRRLLPLSPPSFSCDSRETGDSELRAGSMRVGYRATVQGPRAQGKPPDYECRRRYACDACGDALARVRQVAFYALALPLGIGLAFHGDMGLPGLWCRPPRTHIVHPTRTHKPQPLET